MAVIDIGIEDKLLELVEKIAIEKYSNGDMTFDELARISGYEEALTFQVGTKTIKESIELADKMFKD
jgi:hypothetical protein